MSRVAFSSSNYSGYSAEQLNLFFVADDAGSAEAFHAVSAVWADMAPGAHPAMTPVRVHELVRDGLLVQADCIALK